MIVKDKKGNELLELLPVEKSCMANSYQPITHALAVIKIGDDYLMGWNHWRQDWEIFGGCIEEGESARECIVREGDEELGIRTLGYTFLGLMKYRMAPGYFHPEWHEEYGALYGLTLPEAAFDEISARRKDREEIERIAYYSAIKGKEEIAKIDEKLLGYWE